MLLNRRFDDNRSVSLPLSLSMSFSLLVKGSYCVSRFMKAFEGKDFFETEEAIAITDLNKQWWDCCSSSRGNDEMTRLLCVEQIQEEKM
jgi:hypothetical protein